MIARRVRARAQNYEIFWGSIADIEQGFSENLI
jgi:hypothetical protein